MATYKKILKDKDGNQILPYTEATAVVMDDQVTLLQDVTNSLEENKANINSPTFTGVVTLPSTTSIGTITNTELAILDGATITTAELNTLDGIVATVTELNYTDGLTSNIQTQLNTKQATITGGATTIVSNNLVVSRALVSDGSGKVAVSAVTSTEIDYLNGVTSAIQTQLNSKANSSSPSISNPTLTGSVTDGAYYFPRMNVGTADATTSTCPVGWIYGKY